MFPILHGIPPSIFTYSREETIYARTSARLSGRIDLLETGGWGVFYDSDLHPRLLAIRASELLSRESLASPLAQVHNTRSVCLRLADPPDSPDSLD